MKLYPVKILNHPQASVTKLLLSPNAEKDRVLRRSYFLLVTKHGVRPEAAKKLLGLGGDYEFCN